ncbi:MAG: tRNA (adenosine(37)-N6)-dimethylallyltransferase MiaA [Candidatus Nanopelagicales bacterium]
MKPLVAVVGPTASGKSDLALEIAMARRGEIINLDASQIYRGMDIGTAKTPACERGGVPHHMIDLLEVRQSASVAEFQQLARAAIDEVRERDHLPVCVGGSGLYVRAVLEDLEFPRTDPALRARLEAELERVGAAALHARLASVDARAAAAILPGNTRRVVRALEVLELTGRPFAAVLPQHARREPDVRIGLTVPRELLLVRIRERVQRMWAAGLVDEVRWLEAQGLRQGRTAPKALGYQQVLAFLAGECSETAALEATVAGTVKFARRQMQWFRRDQAIQWLEFDDPRLLQRALALIDAAPAQPH